MYIIYLYVKVILVLTLKSLKTLGGIKAAGEQCCHSWHYV